MFNTTILPLVSLLFDVTEFWHWEESVRREILRVSFLNEELGKAHQSA